VLDGWCAGLALVAAGAAPQLEPRDLVMEVLERLPKDLREVIPEAAVLEEWSEAEAKKIGCNLPKGWLKSALQVGLPMTPMGSGVYRPHTIFIEALEIILLEKPTRHAELHKIAGEFAEEAGNETRALNHFRLAHCRLSLQRLLETITLKNLQLWQFQLTLDILLSVPRDALNDSQTARMAHCYLELGDEEKSREIITDLMSNSSGLENIEVMSIFCLLEYRDAKTENPLLLIEDLLKKDLNYKARVDFLIRRGAIKLHSNKFESAFEDFQAAEKISRLNKDFYLIESSLSWLIICYEQAEEKQKALNAYEEQYKIAEKSGSQSRLAAAVIAFANSLLNAGKTHESIDFLLPNIYKMKDKNDNMLPRLKYQLCLGYLRYGDLTRAKDVALDVLNNEAHLLSRTWLHGINVLLTQIFCFLGDKQKASDSLDSARKISDLGLLAKYQGLHDFTEGIKFFFDKNTKSASMFFQKALDTAIDTRFIVRILGYLAEIDRLSFILDKQSIDKIITKLNSIGNDSILLIDKIFLSGLYAECITRGWYSERFKEILEFRLNSTNISKLTLNSFENFEINFDSEIIRLPLKKSTELFIWLAIHGPATRDEIITALWGKNFTSKDVEYFKVAARRLRTALSEHPSITFNPLPFEHGVYRIAEQFDLHLDIAPLISDAPDSSADILALLESYKGEFLPGFQGEWVENIRTRALDTLLERGLALGRQLEQLDPMDAIRVYDRIRALDALCEPAYQGLERVYRTLGQEANAVDTAKAWQKAVRS
jgi:LuxR family transcriptional regulator, maltose regulon positive regulatory protein